MTALSFIPAFVMLMTSFTRIIIVFSILRQALGLQQNAVEPDPHRPDAVPHAVHHGAGVRPD